MVTPEPGQPDAAAGKRDPLQRQSCEECGGPRGKKPGRFCSDRCRFAAWDRDNPRHPRQSVLRLEAPSAPRTGALRSFHIKGHMPVPEAMAGERRARSQEADVLAWMQAHPGRWTPVDVHRGLDTPAPLTSIRRAMSDLSKHGRLRHWPADRRLGAYGALNSVWEAPA